ncbi:MAG TPA: hypothetical protein VNG29_03695, partial [Candidatus Paceibacterota bacterium]|nr:hypothetical protein [Candidatus Paceibacterota bacterium]
NLPRTDNRLTAPKTRLATIIDEPRSGNETRNSLAADRAIYSVTWSLALLFVAVLWLAKGIAAVFSLVFLGGLVKLCGGMGWFLLYAALGGLTVALFYSLRKLILTVVAERKARTQRRYNDIMKNIP